MECIEEKWAEEEIKEYEEIRNKELEHMYAIIGIPTNKPEERAKYLIKIMQLPLPTCDLIRKIAAEEGKAKALQVLEYMAIKNFI